MNNFIDISLKIQPGMAAWPGEKEIEFKRIQSLDKGDISTSTNISMSVHSGTHIDAPSHFIASGKTIDQMDMDVFMGPVRIVHLPTQDKITAQDLKNSNIPPGTTRLLFRTMNSEYWQKSPKVFQSDFVALTEDAAKWIVNKKVKLVGIDYLSIQPFHHSPDVHRILLESGIAVLEGLDLNGVKDTDYHLICLPLKMIGTEGAPARAVLTKLNISFQEI